MKSILAARQQDRNTTDLGSEPRIPFSTPATTDRGLGYIADVLASGSLTGDSAFSRRCEQWMEKNLDVRKALLVPSCTAALELSALLLDLSPGDEVIMPSFTFASTANAFVLRGAVPVFVDIHADTLNMDPEAVAAAITSRTKAIVAVHYAGQACDLQALQELAQAHGLALVEDAAQGLLSEYRGQSLGSFGRFGCVSFHASKNVTSGHGGALLINNDADVERAMTIRDRGTDRACFLSGKRDKYSWVDVGSSFYLSEICSAHLFAQLEAAQAITARRQAICARYRAGLQSLATLDALRLPVEVPDQTGNGHIFFVMTRTGEERERLREHVDGRGIDACFHYTPLHTSTAGRRYGRAHGPLARTLAASQTILRLPVFPAMTDIQIDRTIAAVRSFYRA